MSQEVYVLHELNTGIKMGMDSISTVSEKVGDQNFKDDLLFQYNQYNEILNKVNVQLEKYNQFPEEVNLAQKAMGWGEIQMNTMTDKSNSKIAELLLKGVNMGIISGVRLLNQNENIHQDTKDILNEFIDFQENTAQKLKSYL